MKPIVSRKQNYIQDLSSQRSVKAGGRNIDKQVLELTKLTFAVLESKEQILGKDLVDMSGRELEALIPYVTELFEAEDYGLLCGAGERGKDLAVAFVLYLYNRWNHKVFLSAEEARANKGSPLTNTRLFKDASAMTWIIRSPEHLDELLNSWLDPTEADTVDCCTRAIVWMAYCGMTEEEIVSTKVGDVDLDEGIIHAKRSGVPVSIKMCSEAWPCLKKLVELDKFWCERPGLTNGYAWIKRQAGDQLIRGQKLKGYSPTVSDARKRINNAMVRKLGNKMMAFSLTYRTVYKCGVFESVYKMESINSLQSAEDALLEYAMETMADISGLEERLRERRVRDRKHQVRQEYNIWKSFRK